MNRWRGRLGLVVLLSLEFGAAASAQDPPPAAEPVLQVPAPPANPGGFIQQPQRRPCPLLNSHGLGCWSHHNRPTCSSLRSEITFIFGSCRTFFGEPCLLGPPPVPVPPGYEDAAPPCGCR